VTFIYSSVLQTVVRGPLGVREALAGVRGIFFLVEFIEKRVNYCIQSLLKICS